MIFLWKQSVNSHQNLQMLTVYYMVHKQEKKNVILYPPFIHFSTLFEESHYTIYIYL